MIGCNGINDPLDSVRLIASVKLLKVGAWIEKVLESMPYHVCVRDTAPIHHVI